MPRGGAVTAGHDRSAHTAVNGQHVWLTAGAVPLARDRERTHGRVAHPPLRRGPGVRRRSIGSCLASASVEEQWSPPALRLLVRSEVRDTIRDTLASPRLRPALEIPPYSQDELAARAAQRASSSG